MFAAPFSSDADFVNIRGEHFSGRGTIEAGHQAIYRGSSNRDEITHVRTLDDRTILAHATAELNSPSGPLAGINHSVFSMLIRKSPHGWQIEAFHNTLIPPATLGPS